MNKSAPHGGYMINMKDYGAQPLVVNIDRYTKANKNYRTVLWTGKDMQVAIMSIPVGSDIGLEIHPDNDQFIRIEEGYALIEMGKAQNALKLRQRADAEYAAIVPAGIWHNITNIGNSPLKIYTVYAPPHHPFGTVHKTKEDAQKAEN